MSANGARWESDPIFRLFLFFVKLHFWSLPNVFAAAPAFADSPGDLAGGPDIYQVRNVTQNDTSYGSSVSAACGDTVKYSVKLSNTDYGQLTNVMVKASLASGQMNASATTANGGTTSTSGKVTVAVPNNGSLSYVDGTTMLYTVDGQLIKNLPDGVPASGVNAGDLNGSTREFLQFEAKVNCPTPPKECKPGVPVGSPKCETTPVTPATPTTPITPTAPQQLVNTGPGAVVGIFTAVTAASAVAYRFFLSRRLARS